MPFNLSLILYSLLGAVINMVIGFLWYSPVLFGNVWAKMMGMKDMSPDEMKKGLGRIYGLTFLAAMLTMYVLQLIIGRLNPAGLPTLGIVYGVFIWLGFVTTVQFTNWLFSKKPFQLFLIDTGYQLVSYIVLSLLASVATR